MSKLRVLKTKLGKRVESLLHHSTDFDRHHKKGHKLRAAWQRRHIRADKKAIKKLKRLISAEEKRIAKARVVDWSGHPALRGNVKDCAKVALNAHSDLYITATTDGVHSPTSLHYEAEAFDAGSSGRYGEAPEIAAQEALIEEFGADHFQELFGPAGWYVKNGQVFSGTFPGHGDHLHAAPYA